MGYTGPYSLGARCSTEALATGFMIFMGDGVIANELLSKTKGQASSFSHVEVLIPHHPGHTPWH